MFFTVIQYPGSDYSIESPVFDNNKIIVLTTHKIIDDRIDCAVSIAEPVTYHRPGADQIRLRDLYRVPEKKINIFLSIIVKKEQKNNLPLIH